MAGSLDGVLANIPGLGGYLAKRQMNEQAPMQDLQQLGALAQLQAQMVSQQQDQQLRGALASSGGDLTKAMQAAIQSGNLAGAAKLAPLIKAQQGEGQPIGAGGLRLPDGTIVPPVPRPQADNRPEILRLQDALKVLPETDPNRKVIQDRMSYLTTRQQPTESRTELEKLIDARDALPEGDRRRELFDRRIGILNKSAAPVVSIQQPRNLQLTADEQGNQLIVNPDGTTRPLQAPGGGGVKKPVGTDKPMTEFQAKASLYGTRAAQSDKVLKALEDTVSTTGMEAKAKLGTVGNFMMSEAEQRVKQAQRDFVNAVLRQESGAVISDPEFANATKQYFPQPGDRPEVVAQKRANRLVAINGFSRLSGPKGAADIKAIIDEPLLPGTSATTPTPQQSNQRPGGYVETRRTADGRLLGKKADGTIEEIRQ